MEPCEHCLPNSTFLINDTEQQYFAMKRNKIIPVIILFRFTRNRQCDMRCKYKYIILF